jgi:hypothetical protein
MSELASEPVSQGPSRSANQAQRGRAGSPPSNGRTTSDPHCELYLPDSAERDELGAFAARVVRLDQAAAVRLRAVGDRVVAWAPTPFDALVSRAVYGELSPSDLTVQANDLLTALVVVRDAHVKPGRNVDGRWLTELPPTEGWRIVEEVSAAELEVLAERGIALAREHAGLPGTSPSSLLDQTVLTASGDGTRVQVPLRCLFALSGMGFLGGDASEDRVRISVTDSWLRLDLARYGAVIRRRHPLLPLVF